MRHFPITWKNQILTPSYSVFYMPLSFPGKKNRPKRDTFQLHGKTKSWLLPTLYSILMPLSFPGKKIGQNETLSNYMEKPNLDYFQLCMYVICHFIFPKEPKMASFLLRWRHRPNWYTFPLHDLLAKSTNFDPANKKKI